MQMEIISQLTSEIFFSGDQCEAEVYQGQQRDDQRGEQQHRWRSVGAQTQTEHESGESGEECGRGLVTLWSGGAGGGGQSGEGCQWPGVPDECH